MISPKGLLIAIPSIKTASGGNEDIGMTNSCHISTNINNLIRYTGKQTLIPNECINLFSMLKGQFFI